MKSLILFIALFLVGCGSGSGSGGSEDINSKKIKEPSGLLISKKYPDVLWTHNDSGDDAYIYAISAKDLELIKKVKIKKADNVDWEDISYLGDQIVIGDFGNNNSDRDDLKLYIVNEPDPYKGDGDVKIRDEIDFIFSDQKDYDKHYQNFDCEALFSYDNTLYLLSKHHEDSATTLYKIVPKDDLADKILDYDFGSIVTGADSDGTRIAVLTKDALYLLIPSGMSDNIFDGDIYKKDISTLGQVEGVAIGSDYIKIIDEESSVYRYSIESVIAAQHIQ